MRGDAPRDEQPFDQRVTLVVLTYNRRAEVLASLERLRILPEGPRILVVDNGSSDGTAEAVRARFPEVQLIRSRINLGAAGRNLGVARALTPYVAFADDDTVWLPGTLSLAANILDAYPTIASCTARVVVEPSGAIDPVSRLMAESPLRSPYHPFPVTIGFLAGASVMRVAAFREGGGYERELFLGGEEELLSLDLLARAWELVYVEALEVRHRPSVARDATGRRLLLARNAMLVAWLRLSATEALQRSARWLLLGLYHVRPGHWAQAFRLLRWAWGRRRVVPPGVIAQLEAVRRAERARGKAPDSGRFFPGSIRLPEKSSRPH